jgi:hypothetical protein
MGNVVQKFHPDQLLAAAKVFSILGAISFTLCVVLAGVNYHEDLATEKEFPERAEARKNQLIGASVALALFLAGLGCGYVKVGSKDSATLMVSQVGAGENFVRVGGELNNTTAWAVLTGAAFAPLVYVLLSQSSMMAPREDPWPPGQDDTSNWSLGPGGKIIVTPEPAAARSAPSDSPYSPPEGPSTRASNTGLAVAVLISIVLTLGAVIAASIIAGGVRLKVHLQERSGGEGV